MKFFFFILSAWLPNRHTYYSHGVNHLDLRDLDQKMSSAGRALYKEHRGDSRTLCCAPVTMGRVHIVHHYICRALMSLFELQPAETFHSQGKDMDAFRS